VKSEFCKWLCLSLAAAWILTGCSFRSAKSPSPEPQYQTASSILEVVKDFRRLAREDLYRFAVPKDITGDNIFKATLVRLEDYEKKNPGQFSDVVEFTKAMAYERLRDYEQAVAHYRKVAEREGQLKDETAKNIETLETFLTIIKRPLDAQDPFQYIKALDVKVSDWNALIKKHQGTVYEFLAREEEEQVDRAKVTFVELNRYRMKDGNQLVILGYTQLATKHRQSKNLYRHLLDFGDFYYTLSKEYVLQNDPEGLSFDSGAFDQFAKSALSLYTEVAQVDGIAEKIEAQGKIEALRGLMERTRRLSR